ncbi:MAG: hypothetical protein ABI728_04720 [Betaproteobacteria bacterium]
MNSDDRPNETAGESQPGSHEAQVDSERREAMRRIGKYTAYVAPAMLALVNTRNAAAS